MIAGYRIRNNMQITEECLREIFGRDVEVNPLEWDGDKGNLREGYFNRRVGGAVIVFKTGEATFTLAGDCRAAQKTRNSLENKARFELKEIFA